MDTTVLLQALVSGVLIGGVFALAAVGLTLIFGVLRIINFAHGEFLMLGMYTSYWLFAFFRVDPFVSLVVTLPAFFALGAVVERGLVAPILKAPEEIQILLTLGLSLFLQNLALTLWSPDSRVVSVDYATSTIRLGTAYLSLPRMGAFASAIVISVGLYMFLKGTEVGRAIRAAADSREGAQLVGIDVRRIYWIAFGIGTACVGAAGSIITPFFFTSPHAGLVFTLTSFVVVVLGSLGNFVGALVGGIIIGVAESLGEVFMPGSMKQVVTFGIFILVLLFRPTGLFGGRRL
ncbi:MAG: branched-chain amino acid ABC transporter permease [Candidatus Methylomirabilia bacterium]